MTTICTCPKCGLRHIQLYARTDQQMINNIEKVIVASLIDNWNIKVTAKAIYNAIHMGD